MAGLLLFMPLLRLSPVKNPVEFLPLNSFLTGYAANIFKYYSLITTWWNKIWILLGVAVLLAALILYIRQSKESRILSGFLFVMGTALMLLLSFGAFAVLREPEYLPRTMYGVGVLLAIMGSYVAAAKKTVLCKGPVILLSWCFFVFAFQYGNALAAQDRYVDYRIKLLMSDLLNTDVLDDESPTHIQVRGDVGWASVIEGMHYPMVKHLIPVEFKETPYGQYRFLHFYKLMELTSVLSDVEGQNIDMDAMNLPIVKETPFHVIYAKDHYILIELKN